MSTCRRWRQDTPLWLITTCPNRSSGCKFSELAKPRPQAIPSPNPSFDSLPYCTAVTRTQGPCLQATHPATAAPSRPVQSSLQTTCGRFAKNMEDCKRSYCEGSSPTFAARVFSSSPVSPSLTDSETMINQNLPGERSHPTREEYED